MKFKILISLLLLPCICLAADKSEPNVWVNLLVASFPVLLIFVLVWLISKKGKSINERVVESNLEVARQIQRIADHLEKQSK